MRLAIMQPYFFPYIGYWQLISAVERFVVYDDVNYIVRGWVNRNRILVNGNPSYITVPLDHASQNKKINEINVQESDVWRKKMLRTISGAYCKANYYNEVYPVIEELIQYHARNLSEYLTYSLVNLARYIGIGAEFVKSSTIYKNSNLSGQDRILDICMQESATTYINAYGGIKLYNANYFFSNDIDLSFILPRQYSYLQRSSGFTKDLSVIDVLMEVGPTGVNELLTEYDLKDGEINE